MENGKAQFFVKNQILHRKYIGKHDREGVIQLVVPESLREKVVSLAHDTLGWLVGWLEFNGTFNTE